MSIGWLWHFTHADNPNALPARNAQSAAAIYSRWRRVHRRFEDFAWQLRTTWRTWSRQRAGHKALNELSAHLLRDVGLQRLGDGTFGSLPHDRLDHQRRATSSVPTSLPSPWLGTAREMSLDGQSSQPAIFTAGIRCAVHHLPTSVCKRDHRVDQEMADADHTAQEISSAMPSDHDPGSRVASTRQQR